MGITGITSLLFALRGPLSRKSYALLGSGLFLVKYAMDTALAAAFAEHLPGPVMYLHPVLSQRLAALGSYERWLPIALVVSSLPFAWVGVVLTLRRLEDARLPPWPVLLFFVPVVNLLLMVGLCFAPGRAPTSAGRERAHAAALELWIAARAVLAGAAFGVLSMLLAVYGSGQYGSVLFMGSPFLIGVISAVLSDRHGVRGLRSTLTIAALSVTVCGGALLLFALEGVICLLMAAVLAYPLALLGAVVGRALAQSRGAGPSSASMVAIWPVLAFMPWEQPTAFELRRVATRVEITAPPDVVWSNVVGFSELPPPREWVLRTGVAYPLRARIEGEGVGAIRYCEFSTGAFVEPITSWDPPGRLAFDVIEQPPSMREWSPYEVVHAPHVIGGLQSERGEFLLEALPGGSTRLTGTTWYRLKMSPNVYWGVYADWVIHAIHGRVLRHVKALSEGTASSG